MKISTFALFLTLLTFLTSPQADEFDQQKATAESKATVMAFGSALKTELITSMKAGGPVKALAVCNLRAAPITAAMTKEKDAHVSRVSLKNRNPDNTPNDWQKAVLEEFEARAAAGENIAPMASVSVVETNGKKQFRFLKAVPTEGACLACHGQQISPEVQARLDVLYPEDKATGYNIGEVRGAVVVVKDY